MKKQVIILALGAVLAASCADDFDRSYQVPRPQEVQNYAYLNDYKPLKNYLTDPALHLGVGTDVQEYMKQQLVYGLVNTNFNEVVAGNAMKMASVVSDNGTMDFTNVQNFVNMATDAGLSVYGHTLAWHEQQPVKYLNSLLKDKEMEVDPEALEEKEVYTKNWSTAASYDMWGQFPAEITTGPTVDSNGLTLTTTGSIANYWELQYMVADGISLTAGKDYVMRVKLKGDPSNDNFHFVIGAWGNDVKTGVIDFNGEWATKDIPFSATSDIGGVHVLFQSGDYQGTYTIEKVQILSLEKPVMEVEQEIYTQDWTTATSYDMWGQFPNVASYTTDGALTITTTAAIANFWELQYMVADGISLEADAEYVLHINVKGSPDNSNLHYVIGAWGNDVKTGVIDFNGEWATKDIRFSATADLEGVHVLLQSGDYAGTYSIGAVTLGKIVKMNSIPLTEKEKKDTLTWVMDNWMKGMMEATEGKVKAWDVVNEAVAGYDNDGDGFYDLQHTSNSANQFFWQDYLGDIDYVRTAVRLARQYGPQDIKLFINDYNLESDWDGNKKLESLIEWIRRWEQDGVTKIDGIGTQMHVTYFLSPTTQSSKEQAIEKAFKMMGETGKLVRISELDMGIVDAAGNKINTSDVTEEQHKAMTAFYKWIISKYFEIIPAQQQWGVCQWCITDSPADSGWRPNEPTGLWDSQYNRKHTYAGFADGLGGQK